MSDPAIRAHAARAPLTPVLRSGSLRLCRTPAASSDGVLTTLLDGSQTLLTTSARAAIALALEQIGVSRGQEVLLPAYHCQAMRAPIEACGATAVFYRLDGNLNIDMADLEQRVSPRSRCVLTVHFFGFPQDHTAVRELCDRRGLSLIEDCAHAFYGPATPPQIGRSGDFAVGSLMKFFPVFDGGCLVSFRRPLSGPPLRSRGALFQLKALVNMVQMAGTWGHSRLLRGAAAAISGVTALAKGARPTLARQLAESAPGAAQGSLDFQSEWVHADMSEASRLAVRHADHRRAIHRRREVYRQYAAGLASVPGGQPLWPDLPAGVVPYVFPFVLSAPDVSYRALRAAGVPIYRWEDVAEESCATARHYKTRLVQFPCHQSLEEQEVVELIRTIRQVLADCTDIQSSSQPSAAALP